jgi:hypothetical protein
MPHESPPNTQAFFRPFLVPSSVTRTRDACSYHRLGMSKGDSRRPEPNLVFHPSRTSPDFKPAVSASNPSATLSTTKPRLSDGGVWRVLEVCAIAANDSRGSIKAARMVVGLIKRCGAQKQSGPARCEKKRILSDRLTSAHQYIYNYWSVGLGIGTGRGFGFWI